MIHDPSSINSLNLDDPPGKNPRVEEPVILSDAHLLAEFLFQEDRNKRSPQSLRIATEILRTGGGLAGILQWDLQEFLSVKGVGPALARRMVRLLDMIQRIRSASWENAPLLDSPEKIFPFMRLRADGLAVEKCWVLTLNRKNRLKRISEVSSGTATSSLIHPREVFRPSLLDSAAAIILAHNHPTGDPTPSRSDVLVTRKLKEAAKILDILFLDHIIIGTPSGDPHNLGYYSFQENGLM